MSLPVIDRLSLPGIVDVHSHFMPHTVMDKVWAVFDQAKDVYDIEWPITYRTDEPARLATLRGFGVVAFTSLVYAHKPGMAVWLNEWCQSFALNNPDCLQTATFFPESSAAAYVSQALSDGARVFKIHLEVGAFDPRDPLLVPAWGQLAEAGVPAVVHCGSGPRPGPFTGPGPMTEVLDRHPSLKVIVAHMGAPEYEPFLDLADQRENVYLDTTMSFTDFMDELATFPPDRIDQLRVVGERGKILFGSDFPNIPYTYEHAVAAIERLELGDSWTREVLFCAANRLFGLGLR